MLLQLWWHTVSASARGVNKKHKRVIDIIPVEPKPTKLCIFVRLGWFKINSKSVCKPCTKSESKIQSPLKKVNRRKYIWSRENTISLLNEDKVSSLIGGRWYSVHWQRKSSRLYISYLYCYISFYIGLVLSHTSFFK